MGVFRFLLIIKRYRLPTVCDLQMSVTFDWSLGGETTCQGSKVNHLASTSLIPIPDSQKLEAEPDRHFC